MSEITNSFYKGLKEGMERHPENFIQPDVFKDKLTGKYYVNPEFVKRYGNPYNKVNKRDIYLEKDLQWHYDQQEKKKTLKDYQEDIREYYWFNKWNPVYVEQIPHAMHIQCNACTAYNHKDNVLCWYCLRVVRV